MIWSILYKLALVESRLPIIMFYVFTLNFTFIGFILSQQLEQ